ncbi:PKD domain-containing protein [Arthrobacter glacialis]|uniref:PKD domain-containing protein n=1 Tax=Arthrobacter glacialis TaxID=1664 RepID=UPI000CD4354C|nr:PKD domain-containing protein [Arthrobacter glacialis]POH60676.1 PKD domain containing protein [Arthrobacter glacialis]
MRRYIAVFAAVLMVAGLGFTVPNMAAASEATLTTVVRSTPVNYTPNVLDGTVFSIAQVGNTIVLGGQFTQVQASTGGAVLSRNNIVAFNKDTGAISTTFVPQFNSTVRSVVASADGNSVYVGGQFGTLNGASVTKVTRLAISNGAKVAGFNPGLIDAVVHDMKLVGTRLFIGGEFTAINNVPRSSLAELDPATGALRANVNIAFAGTHLGGTTFVHKFDVSPNGATMVVTGNFRTMNGLDRVQVGMVDLTTNPATVANWATDQWKPNCYSVFAYYLNDLDFSPDGNSFVLGSMGGYGSGPPSLCDTMSRWETNATGAAVTPTWVNYTGGDSIYALENTGSTVYFGGHNRWVNNPFAADRAGQGAVEREGIGALNSVNGMPIDWNPGRDRGRGVFDMMATSQGLWVGSDTDRIARYLYRARIAMFPVAGGTTIPTASAPALPVDVMQSGSLNAPLDARYLYRVNAGGETIPTLDGGMDWIGDTAPPGSNYRNTGNAAAYDTVGSRTAAVPATTPTSIFSTERWDAQGNPELMWSFPVPAGKHVQVRLYLSDRCSCTTANGSRVFSMRVDGQMAFQNYDVNASVGHNVGTMLSRDITSDGNVNIEFNHVVENPLVNGLEIVDLDAAAPPPGQTDQMKTLYFDGTTGSGSTAAVTGSVPWDNVRGGFVANGNLYLATATGEFQQRSFNGTQIGAPTALNLYGLTNFAADMQSMTGMFYSNGRIYYTLTGQSNLYMRYFDLSSQIVGSQRFTIVGPTGGMSWTNVRGMFLAGSQLYWASADGNLNAMNWADSVGNGAVSGTSTVVSGPGLDGTNWAAKSLIDKVGTGSVIPPPNQAPTAAFASTCTGLACSFNGAGSTDSDGTVAGYAWTSSDGGTGTGATFARTFAAPGTYTVTLTVTDDDGATGTVSHDVTVAQLPPPNVAPVASFTSDCTFLACTFDGSGSSDSDGTVSSYAWVLPAGATATGAVTTYTFAAAGTYPVNLTVTDNQGATGAITTNVTVAADPNPPVTNPVAFVASAASSATGSANTHTLTIPASVQAGDVLVAAFSTNSGTVAVTGPAGWDSFANAATTSMRGVFYSKVAVAADAGSVMTVGTAAYGRGTLVVSAYRNATVAAASFALQPETVSRAAHTTPTLAAATGSWGLSYWADKTAATTSWVAPAGDSVRQTGAGTGAGHMSWLLTDSNAPLSGSTAGGLGATANSASSAAVMGTVVIARAP